GEVTAQSTESVTYLSADLLVRDPIRTEVASGNAQVRLFGSIAAYVQGELDRVRVKNTGGPTPVDPALLLDRDETRAHVGVRYLRPGWRLQYQLSARRQLQYSAVALDRYFEETRAGAGVHMALGSGGVQLFYERGKDDYFGSLTTPSEDVTSWGASVDFRLFR